MLISKYSLWLSSPFRSEQKCYYLFSKALPFHKRELGDVLAVLSHGIINVRGESVPHQLRGPSSALCKQRGAINVCN